MARKFYRYPPRPSSGAGTFSDNIVGLQIVTGGGLTQGNFDFEISITEKTNRDFNIGAFSDPISLDTLNISSILESNAIIAREFKVYPNFDLSEITRFTLFGPLTKRFEAAVQKIIHYFPAALEVSSVRIDSTSGNTAYNITYNSIDDVTTFEISIDWINNPFVVDFSLNSTRNLSLLDYQVSPLRNLSVEYLKYSLFIGNAEYPLVYLTPTSSLYSGTLQISVLGNPFNGQSTSLDYLVIRPNSVYSDKNLLEPFDEVERFLLNRLITPPYTANFQIPTQSEDGLTYMNYESVTWPLDGVWNLDIRTIAFDNYLNRLGDIADSFDVTRTNLVARFLTTESFKEFDTSDQKIQKVLSIYGRSFDEVKKFIDGLSFMNSVNYTVQNDIPSQLLRNLASTLGWNLCTPATSDDFLASVFGSGGTSQYPGYSRPNTPDELNYQFYRNLILNSAYLFKSKGTRKAIEFLLRLMGAPDSLIEFNENVYVSGQRINMSQFETQYASISGGTYVQNLPVYTTSTYSIQGVTYTAFTGQRIAQDADTTLTDYPVDSEGYPKSVENTDSFYFQKGSGWISVNGNHQPPQSIDNERSVLSGNNFTIQTRFDAFDYGKKYLERYQNFPYMSMGFGINKVIDNKKSWVSINNESRIGNGGSNFNASYYVQNEKSVINTKNSEVFLNPSKGLLYDVWYMSEQYNYPLANSGMSVPYPTPEGVSINVVNTQPTKRSFFEFAQNFWKDTVTARNRQTSARDSSGGYPSLQSIWCDYLNSEQAIGIQNNNFNYQNMIDFVNSLGDCWINLVEQMMPASSLVMAGVKYENSIFHRQKFVYRVQRCCQIIPVPCDPCSIFGTIFPNSCVDETITCHLLPWNNSSANVGSFEDVLYQSLISYLTSLGLVLGDCCETTIIAEWYVIVILDNEVIVETYFYTGYGLNDVPSVDTWLYYVKNNLELQLTDFGLGVTYSGTDEDPIMTIYNIGCEPRFEDKTFSINIGFDFTVDCTGGTTTTTTTFNWYCCEDSTTSTTTNPIVTRTPIIQNIVYPGATYCVTVCSFTSLCDGPCGGQGYGQFVGCSGGSPLYVIPGQDPLTNQGEYFYNNSNPLWATIVFQFIKIGSGISATYYIYDFVSQRYISIGSPTGQCNCVFCTL